MINEVDQFEIGDEVIYRLNSGHLLYEVPATVVFIQRRRVVIQIDGTTDQRRVRPHKLIKRQ